jgi:hypothetical protein
MLRKLAAQGWLTVEGRTAEFVYFRVDPPGRSPPDVVRSDEITPDWLPLLW